MTANYLQILQESLEEKLNILTRIEEKSREQAELLKNPDVNLEVLDRNMDEKAEYIAKIDRLDEGFDSIYEKIKQELVENKDRYREQIGALQELIRQITEKSTGIQAIEMRNKAGVETIFRNRRKSLQSKRNAMDVALGYYQNMNKVRNVGPQFMDKKK
ncbi:MAG: flagellar export chaperone FlgN [Lachnospiraceae bacterium]|nr:flagellar export chaperone FlgN [Lachnospiraceae bacterium]